MPDAAAENKPVQKRRRGWRWPLRILLVLLLAFCIFRFVVHQRVQNRLNAIRAAGYPVTLEELDAWYPYPEGPNAAEVYQQAFEAYVKDEEVEQTLPVFNPDIKLPPPGEPLPEDMAQHLETYLADNAEAIVLLEQAAKIEGCRYPIDLTNGYDTQLPHLGELRYGARLLRLQSICDANQKLYGDAVERCCEIFDLAHSLDGEPNVISSLVRIAILRMGFEQTERLVQGGGLDEEEILKLITAIQQISFDDITERAIAGESCITHIASKDPIRTIYEMGGLFSGKNPNTPTNRFLAGAWRFSGLLDLDKALMLDLFAELNTPANRSTWPLTQLQSKIDGVPAYYIMTRVFKPITSIVRIPMEVHTQQAVFLTGLAVERYRLRNDTLPTKLDQLIPDHIGAIPKDPFTGQTLLYRVEGNGAIIYSISSDGKDNGGRKYDKVGEQYREDTDITFTIGDLQETLWPSEEVTE